ncbi:MDR family MFS transporter [Anaerobacillus sp. MEB173]|uniref:MDR family MFS transporter n=1 Tax=Anaerobacillus sp. MEB173 TaxID=3383345 RepID=UPI003F8EAB5A
MNKLPEKWLVLLTVLVGSFTLVLNNSMLNPAVPQLMKVFESDAVATGWVITIFMVTMGVTMPLTGYLGDKWGNKNLYIFGLVLFTIASILGSFSWNLSSLIFFRGLQGIAGGIMLPITMALIVIAFPRNERGFALGVYGTSALMAPTIGPTLGGILIEMGSWQYLFLCNIPTGLIGLAMAVFCLKQSKNSAKLTFDKWGFLTVTLGVGLILYALARISKLEHLLEPMNILLLLVGALSLYLFAHIEKHVQHPLLDLSIFRISTFTYSVIVSGILSIGLFAGIFLIPLLLQNVYGYGAIMTGLTFLPSALFTAIFMTVSGKTMDKSGARVAVTVGLVIIGVSTILLGLMDVSTALWVIFLLMAVRGAGFGLSSTPATTAGMNAIPEQLVSRGSAMNSVFRQMSSALGIVFVSIYFEVRRVQLIVQDLPFDAASLQAINEGFIVIGILTLLSIPAGWLLGGRNREDQKKGTKTA